MLLQPRDEPRGVRRTVNSDEAADIDQVAFGAVGEPQLRHGSPGKARLQPGKHIGAVLHTPGSDVAECGAQIPPQGGQGLGFVLGRFDRDGHPSVRWGTVRKAAKDALRQFGHWKHHREGFQS
jgi:hypothetical protein